jgi:hypothetical protein
MRFFSEHRVTGCGCQSQKSACLSVRLVRDKLTRTGVQAQGRGPLGCGVSRTGASARAEGPDGVDMRMARPSERASDGATETPRRGQRQRV